MLALWNLYWSSCSLESFIPLVPHLGLWEWRQEEGYRQAPLWSGTLSLWCTLKKKERKRQQALGASSSKTAVQLREMPQMCLSFHILYNLLHSLQYLPIKVLGFSLLYFYFWTCNPIEESSLNRSKITAPTNDLFL